MHNLSAARDCSRLRWGVVLLISMMAIDVTAVPSLTGAAAKITCQLAVPAQLSRNQPAVVTLTLRNRSHETLRLLKRNTPFEGWLADSFNVVRDGQAMPYIGAMAKRTPPTAAEYLTLKAGASYRYRAPLQRAYDASQPGSYQVQWRGELMDAYFGGARPNPEHMQPATISCASASFVRRT